MRQYWIVVKGFDGYQIAAPSAGAAKWAAFTQYDEAGFGHAPGAWFSKSTRFRRFLDRIACCSLGPLSAQSLTPASQTGDGDE